MEKNTQIGYCCINLSLPKGHKVNRSCINRTFLEKGLGYISELAISNLRGTIEVIKWNEKNNVKVYRLTSSLFPWHSEYEFADLPNYDEILTLLREIGSLAKKYNQRIGFHPGHFNVLGSPNKKALDVTIAELNKHGEILDLMGLPQTTAYSINIHCNGVYEGKTETLTRWRNNWKRLDDGARKRLVVENDDKASMYSVKDLYEGVYQKIGVPITFDYHHHRLNTGGLTEEEAIKLAASTWPTGIRQLTHYSSSKRTNEDCTVKVQAHAEYIYEKINTYGLPIDIELESKGKDLALLKYRENEDSLLESYIPLN
jgi:UV DNA damage endonuclease